MDGRNVDRQAAERLGRNLFMARRRAGYSQEEVAARASLHRTEVGMIEHGERLPRVDTLMKLVGALGIRPGELLRGIEWLPGDLAASGRFAIRSPA